MNQMTTLEGTMVIEYTEMEQMGRGVAWYAHDLKFRSSSAAKADDNGKKNDAVRYSA